MIISGQVTLRCHLLRGLQIQLNLADPNSKEATTTARPPKMRSVQVDLGDGASRSLVLDPKRIYSFHVCRADPVGPSQTGPSVATTWSNEVELQSRLSKDWVEILEVSETFLRSLPVVTISGLTMVKASHENNLKQLTLGQSQGRAAVHLGCLAR